MTELEKTEMAKEAKRAYERKWRKENPEKCRAIKQRYWEKKALRDLEQENSNEQ